MGWSSGVGSGDGEKRGEGDRSEEGDRREGRREMFAWKWEGRCEMGKRA